MVVSYLNSLNEVEVKSYLYPFILLISVLLNIVTQMGMSLIDNLFRRQEQMNNYLNAFP